MTGNNPVGEDRDEVSVQGDLFASLDSPPPGSTHENVPGLPFQREPRRATPAHLDSLNDAQGLKGARAFREPQDSAELARTAKSMVPDRLESLLLHPDERVPLALLSNRQNPRPWDKAGYRKRVVDVLYQRAMQTAEHNGVLWSPLLDRLAVKRAWPGNFYSHHGRNYPWNVDETPYAEAPVQVRSAEDQAERLVPWIQEQTDPDVVGDLWAFRYHGVKRRLAEHASCLTPEWIARVLAESEFAPWLARNPSLTPAQREQVAEWALKLFEDPNVAPLTEPAGQHARRALVALDAAMGSVAESVKERLLEVARAPEGPQEASSGRPTYRRRLAATAARQTLVELASTEPALLARLYDAAPEETDIVMAIVKHPNANCPVWRHVVRDTSYFPVRDYLSDVPEARTDPVIRSVLAGSSSDSVLLELCKDASPAEFSRHFRKVVDKDAAAAVQLLVDDEIDPAVVSEEDLLRILEGPLSFPKSRRHRDRQGIEMRLKIKVCFWLRGKRFQTDLTAVHDGEGDVLADRHLRRILKDALAARHDLVATLLDEHYDKVRHLLQPADLAPLLESAERSIRMAAVMALRELETPQADTSRPGRRQPGLTSSR